MVRLPRIGTDYLKKNINMTDKNRTLDPEDAVVLWLKGKEEWNKWADSHPGWTVSFRDVDFDALLPVNQVSKTDSRIPKKYFTEFVFPGGVSFSNIKSTGLVDFSGATFSGSAGFRNVTFGGKAVFWGAKFLKKVHFNNATFCEGADFREIHVFDSADFEKATFSSFANFDRAKFSSTTTFKDIEFSNETLFTSTTFSGMSNFNGSKFNGITSFDSAMFNGSISMKRIETFKPLLFTKSTFNNEVTLEYSTFNHAIDFSKSIFRACVPNLISTKFSYHISVSNLRLPKDERKSDTSKKLQRLRELAASSKDHKMEIELFRLEMISKRNTEPNFLRSLPNYLYGWLSDYGSSISRPFFLLVGSWVFSALGYLQLSDNSVYSTVEQLRNSLHFSATQLVPFLQISKSMKESVTLELFGQGYISPYVYLLAYFEGFVSIILLALLALGLRNRFKMK